jgi:hypothetical protein
MAGWEDFPVVKDGPVVREGPGGGELVATQGPEQLVLPPGQRAQEERAQTVKDAARIGSDAALLGMGSRLEALGAAHRGTAPSYATGLREAEDRNRAAVERSPIATTTAGMAGGLLTGAALPAAGLTTVPRLAARFGPPGTALGSALEGAGLGAAEAAGKTYTGNPADYASAAGWGALGGGAVGGVLAPAVGGLGGFAHRNLATTNTPMGVIPARAAQAAVADRPELERVAQGLVGERYRLTDSPAMTGLGQGAMLDPIDPRQTALKRMLEERDRTSPLAIDQSVNQIFGPAPHPSMLRVQRDVIQPDITAHNRLFDQFLNAPNVRRTDTQRIADWLQNERVNSTDERRAAATRLLGNLELEGSPGVLSPDPRRLHATVSGIKQTLRDDQAAQRVGGAGTLSGGERDLLRDAVRRMDTELDRTVPGYEWLRGQLAERHARKGALERDSIGYQMFDTGDAAMQTPVDFAHDFRAAAVPKGQQNIGPSAEPLYITMAARQKLEDIIGTKKNDLLALEQVLAQPHDYNSQKLVQVFGQQRADQIAQVLREERAGREAFQKIVHGAKTATTLASAKGMEHEAGKVDLGITMTGLAARGLQATKDAIFRRQAAADRAAIAGMLASDNPAQIRAMAQQLLAIQPQRDVRNQLVRTLLQGGTRGAAAGFIGKESLPEELR